MRVQHRAIPVDGGAVPTEIRGPEDASGAPVLFVVPSIFGAAPDLLERLSEFADRASIAVPDPFWRQGGGVIPYADRQPAFARLEGFEPGRCIADLGAVLDWAHAEGNGVVLGLGICFGGPFVLRFASEGRLDGVVTWHGSRMEQHLKRAADVTCPLRLHFGDADAITPPETIDAIRKAFASHPDVSIAVHPGADHGFSHDGPAYDAAACRAGLDAVGELIELRSAGRPA
ncbi:MAG: dienelactone hydrolase family protein [Proteobacteria bacterium]|nr:dienelactone hydrolase family protein [Pseudomonadota bacterium]